MMQYVDKLCLCNEYPVYKRNKHEVSVFEIHMHDVRSKFASCLLYRVN